MAQLDIVQTPHAILHKPVKPIIQIDKKILRLIKDMKDTLVAQTDPQGVGLAAPQVGVSLALFIMKPTLKGKISEFINPKILDSLDRYHNPQSTCEVKNGLLEKAEDSEIDKKLEGCLSIRQIWGPVQRKEKVLLTYQTITGEKKTEWFSGFKATIIQHEVDHLQGILFTQRALEQKQELYKETDEGELEEIES